ncbi:carboxyltransferase domain-containing protein [Arthrobacter sp. OVS8]|nr:carboxyltransferase domain-containing protein [Arthrobacter sp. OVS8]
MLVTADSPVAARRIAARLLRLDLTAPVQRDGELVLIDTVYDGEDLAEVGQLTGLGPDGVIAAHTGQIWTVAFAGFAPGFGYMVGRTRTLRCRGAAPRAPRSPPVRWRWPETIRPCTRAARPAAGS